MTIRTAKAAGVRSPCRAAITARTLRTDRWWAYPLTTFTSVILSFRVSQACDLRCPVVDSVADGTLAA